MSSTQTDKYGFSIRTCTRCGGSGHYSFTPRYGTTCFGCGGKGVQHTPKAAKAFAAWTTAVRAARRPSVDRLVAGDRITFDMNFSGRVVAGATWKTVASTNPLPLVCGHSVVNGVAVNHVAKFVVTYDDGTTETLGGNILCARKADVDVAPYVC